jgi:hypothetical protein
MLESERSSSSPVQHMKTKTFLSKNCKTPHQNLNKGHRLENWSGDKRWMTGRFFRQYVYDMLQPDSNSLLPSENTTLQAGTFSQEKMVPCLFCNGYKNFESSQINCQFFSVIPPKTARDVKRITSARIPNQ